MYDLSDSASSPTVLSVGTTYTVTSTGADLGGWFSFWADYDSVYTIIVTTDHAELSTALGSLDVESTSFAPIGVDWPAGSDTHPGEGAVQIAAYDSVYADYYTRVTLETANASSPLSLLYTPAELSGWYVAPVWAFEPYYGAHTISETKTYTYQVTVVEGDGTDFIVDDWGNDAATGGQFDKVLTASLTSPDQVISGVIEAPEDQDVFNITLRAGFVYDIHVATADGTEIHDPLDFIDVDVNLLSGLWLSSGHYELLGTSAEGGVATAGLSLSWQQSWAPGEEVEATITVQGAVNPLTGQRDTGAYTVWVTPADDHGGNEKSPDTIGRPGTQTGHIEEPDPEAWANVFGEEDWFAIEGGVIEGYTYVITSKSLSDGLTSLDLSLYLDTGALLETPHRDFLIYEADRTENMFVAVEATFGNEFGDYEIELGQYSGKVEIYDGKKDRTVSGSARDDLLELAGGDDIVKGLGGNDDISGGAGRDRLIGGAGSDDLSGDGGNDKLSGGGGKDSLLGGAGKDKLAGDAGNDLLSGGSGNDDLSGGGGADRLEGGKGADTLSGGKGADWLAGEDGNDLLKGDGGNDTLSGGAGRDKLWGGAGNDTLIGGTGADVLNGDGGDDLFLWTSAEDDGSEDIFRGGTGHDTVRLIVSDAVAADGLFQSELTAYEALLASGGTAGTSFTFTSLGLTLTDMEEIRVITGSGRLTATSDQATIGENEARARVAGNLLDNDSGADPLAALTVTAVAGSATGVGDSVAGRYGSFLIRSDGSYRYTLDAESAAVQALTEGDSLTDRIAYSVTDGSGTATTTLSIDITGANDAPIMPKTTASVSDDESFLQLALSSLADDPDSDDGGSSLSYALTSLPGEGRAEIRDGALRFYPGSDFTDLAEGETRKVKIGLSATDSHGDTGTGVVTVTVVGTNDAPQLAPGTLAVTDGGPAVTFDLTTLGSDPDSDDDGSTLTYSVPYGPYGSTASITDGVLSLDPGSAFQFVAEGETRTIALAVRVTDSKGASTTGALELLVTGTNDAPHFIDTDAYGVLSGGLQGLFLRSLVTDPDIGDAANLSYAITTPPTGGSAWIEDGDLYDFYFRADEGFADLAVGETRDAIIGITVTDSSGASDSGTITIPVTGVNDAPTLTAGWLAAMEDGGEVTLDLKTLGDDPDSDDDGSSLGYTLVSYPGMGATWVSSDGVLHFDPGADFQELAAGETRDLSVGIRASDSHGDTVQGMVTVTVTGENDAPVLSDAVLFAVDDDPSVSLNLAKLGSDPDGDDDGVSLSYAITAGPSEGSASIRYGVLSFVPGEDFKDLAEGESREVTVGITATDSHGATASSEVIITVTGVNTAPELSDGALSAVRDGDAVTLDLASLSYDKDDDALTYFISTDPDEGTASILGDILTFDPGDDFQSVYPGRTRDVVIEVTVMDTSGATATGTVTATVSGGTIPKVPMSASAAANTFSEAEAGRKATVSVEEDGFMFAGGAETADIGVQYRNNDGFDDLLANFPQVDKDWPLNVGNGNADYSDVMAFSDFAALEGLRFSQVEHSGLAML